MCPSSLRWCLSGVRWLLSKTFVSQGCPLFWCFARRKSMGFPRQECWRRLPFSFLIHVCIHFLRSLVGYSLWGLKRVSFQKIWYSFCPLSCRGEKTYKCKNWSHTRYQNPPQKIIQSSGTFCGINGYIKSEMQHSWETEKPFYKRSSEIF